jgi:hypothetical protein
MNTGIAGTGSIEDLYHRSMEFGTGEREAFLRDRCADDLS